MESQLSETLKVLRKKRHYSIRELARKSGVSHTYLAQIEARTRPKDRGSPRLIRPSPEVLRRIANFLGENSYGMLMEAAGYWPPEHEPRTAPAILPVLRNLPNNVSSVEQMPDKLVVIFHIFTEILLQQNPASVPELAPEENVSSTSQNLAVVFQKALAEARITGLETIGKRLATYDTRPSRLFAQLVSWLEGESNPAYRHLVEALRFKEEGKLNAAIEAYEHALRRTTNPMLVGNIDRVLGRLYSEDHQCRLSLFHFRRAVEELDLFLTPRERAKLCTETGWLSCLVDSPHEAIKYLSRAIRELENVKDSDTGKILREALHAVATAYSYIAEFKKALENDKRAYNVAEESKDEDGLAWSTFALGMDYVNTGDWKTGARLISDGLAASEKRQLKVLEAICCNELGRLRLRMGDCTSAIEYCQRALKINEKENLEWGIPHSYELLAHINTEKTRRERSNAPLALFYLTEAIRRFAALCCDFRVMTCYANLAEIYVALGYSELGLVAARQSSEIAVRRGYRLGEAVSYRVMGMAHIESGNLTDARKMLTIGLNVAEEIGEQYELGKIYRSSAILAGKENNRSLAREHASQAVQLFTRLGARADLERTYAVCKCQAIEMNDRNQPEPT